MDQSADRYVSLIERCEALAPSLPVPTLPVNYSSTGWFVRPDIAAKQLDEESPLFALRIEYDDGARKGQVTINAFSAYVDPVRARGQVYDLVLPALVRLRRRLFVFA